MAFEAPRNSYILFNTNRMKILSQSWFFFFFQSSEGLIGISLYDVKLFNLKVLHLYCIEKTQYSNEFQLSVHLKYFAIFKTLFLETHPQQRRSNPGSNDFFVGYMPFIDLSYNVNVILLSI